MILSRFSARGLWLSLVCSCVMVLVAHCFLVLGQGQMLPSASSTDGAAETFVESHNNNHRRNHRQRRQLFWADAACTSDLTNCRAALAGERRNCRLRADSGFLNFNVIAEWLFGWFTNPTSAFNVAYWFDWWIILLQGADACLRDRDVCRVELQLYVCYADHDGADPDGTSTAAPVPPPVPTPAPNANDDNATTRVVRTCAPGAHLSMDTSPFPLGVCCRTGWVCTDHADCNTNFDTNSTVLPDDPHYDHCQPAADWLLEDAAATETTTTEVVAGWMVMGDTPYSTKDRYCLNEQLRELPSLRTDNSDSDNKAPAAILHVGDIRKQTWRTTCQEADFRHFAELIAHPSNTAQYDPAQFHIVPGDNEWNDCIYPFWAWNLWMKYFGPDNAYGIGLSSAVERQPQRLENIRFLVGQDGTAVVLTIGINLTGSVPVGDEMIRFRHNLDWIRESLELYQPDALLIFAQAYWSDHRRPFGEDLTAYLQRNHPNLPVLYIHGDDHRVNYRVNPTDFNVPNLAVACVALGGEAPPLHVTLVRLSAGAPNHAQAPRFAWNVDDRGGRYEQNGSADSNDSTSVCPLNGNTDVTWNVDDGQDAAPPP